MVCSEIFNLEIIIFRIVAVFPNQLILEENGLLKRRKENKQALTASSTVITFSHTYACASTEQPYNITLSQLRSLLCDAKIGASDDAVVRGARELSVQTGAIAATKDLAENSLRRCWFFTFFNGIWCNAYTLWHLTPSPRGLYTIIHY